MTKVKSKSMIHTVYYLSCVTKAYTDVFVEQCALKHPSHSWVVMHNMTSTGSVSPPPSLKYVDETREGVNPIKER